MKTQAEMFYEWGEKSDGLKALKVFIQNDLLEALNDNKITQKDIKDAFHEFSDLYHVRRKGLDDLYNMIQLFHLTLLVAGGDKEHDMIIDRINNID